MRVMRSCLRWPMGWGDCSRGRSRRKRSVCWCGAGQRQLLSLARALLVDPAILLLDEATANLDLATEARVQKAMGLVARGRTTLVIAHRLQTARTLQRIRVVDNGLIVEDGSHDELLALGGRYAQLWSAMISSARTGQS
jgi:ATP-binding cassette subfamily B protein